MIQDPLPVEPPRYRWTVIDLVAFAVFFLAALLIVQLAFFYAVKAFGPRLQGSVVAAVVAQGVIDSIVVVFIFFLVRVVHGFSFKETIHWNRHYNYTSGTLMGLGVMLALSVALTSTLFPQADQTPIEKLLSSAKSLYIFAVFGILIAPLFEEIIFRGFLFKVFSDMRGPGLAVPATALLFSSLHALQLWGNWAAVLLIFAVGFILAVIRERSNSLIPGLIVHTAYNSTLFGMYALGTLVQSLKH